MTFPDQMLYSIYLSIPESDSKQEMEEGICTMVEAVFPPERSKLASLIARSILSGAFHSASSEMLEDCEIDLFDSDEDMQEFASEVMRLVMEGVDGHLNIVVGEYVSKKVVNDSVVYEYSDKHLRNRLKKKRSAIKKLNSEMSRIRKRYKKDMASSDLQVRNTALAVAIIDEIHERVGNKANVNTGVTSLKKKHVSVRGNKVKFNYVGKSGMTQSKELTSPQIASTLKVVLKDKKPSAYVFDFDSDGQSMSISPKEVNVFLSDFNITAKDMRGYAANRLIYEELKKVRKGRLPKDVDDKSKQLKEELAAAIDIVAERVGHTSSTCKNQYIMPEIIESFLIDGKVTKVSTLDSDGLIRFADLSSEAGFKDWWGKVKDFFAGSDDEDTDDEIIDDSLVEDDPAPADEDGIEDMVVEDKDLPEHEVAIIVINRLNPDKESCEECVAASKAGYMKISEMITAHKLPGNRRCRSNCGCEVITEDGRFYRSAKLKTKRDLDKEKKKKKYAPVENVGVLRQNYDLGMSGRAPSTDDDEYNATSIPDPLESKSPW